MSDEELAAWEDGWLLPSPPEEPIDWVAECGVVHVVVVAERVLLSLKRHNARGYAKGCRCTTCTDDKI